MAANPGRPDPAEIAPHAKIYVDLVPGTDVLKLLAEQVGQTTSLVRAMGEKRAGEFAYAPGKWTPKQIVGHLSDTERIFTYRALRIARQDKTPLPGFEQDDYVEASGANDRTLDDLLNEFRMVRESSLALFGSLPLNAWARKGRVSDWELSVRGIAFTASGHELHHFKILQERYAQ